jgi:hypothetical protein
MHGAAVGPRTLRAGGRSLRAGWRLRRAAGRYGAARRRQRCMSRWAAREAELASAYISRLWFSACLRARLLIAMAIVPGRP